jgi:outer membrane protein assembly factor BamA
MMVRSLAILLLSSSFATAQQYPIIDVSASGSKRYQPAEIVAYIGLKKDISKPISLEKVRDAAQKLVNSGVFSNVGYRHAAATGGMTVTFTVQDKPEDQFLPVIFENIVWRTDDELRAALQKRVPLFHADVPIEGQLTDEIATAISEELKTSGVEAHVTSEQSCASGQERCLRRLWIDNLQIITAAVDPHGAPPEVIDEVKKAAAGTLLGKPFTMSGAGAKFVELVRASCLKRGLLKPEIGQPTPKVISQNGENVAVALSAPVQPGRAYNFEGQQWQGNSAIPSAQLEKMVHLYLHLPVDGAKLEQDLTQVRAQYAARGYMQAHITPGAVLDDAKGEVRYTFNVAEGPLLKMGVFDVSGFPDKVSAQVRDLWKLRQGDPFDRVYIEKFFRDPLIQRLFSGQSFVVEQSEGDDPNTLDVTVALCMASGCKPSPNALFVSGPATQPQPESH